MLETARENIYRIRDGKCPVAKIVMWGGGGVGTTTLLYRMAYDLFHSETPMTRGVQFWIIPAMYKNWRVILQILDLAGEEQWREFQVDLIKGTCCAVLAYDISRASTLEDLVFTFAYSGKNIRMSHCWLLG